MASSFSTNLPKICKSWNKIGNITNIGEINDVKNRLVKVVDVLGRETKERNQPLFYIYDDGVVEKKIIIVDRVVSYGELTASDTTTDLTIRLGSPTSGSSNVQTGMYSVILLKDSGSDLGGNNTVTIAPNTSSRFFINGSSDLVFCDGAGSGAAVTSVAASLDLNNNTAIAGTATALSIALG